MGRVRRRREPRRPSPPVARPRARRQVQPSPRQLSRVPSLLDGRGQDGHGHGAHQPHLHRRRDGVHPRPLRGQALRHRAAVCGAHSRGGRALPGPQGRDRGATARAAPRAACRPRRRDASGTSRAARRDLHAVHVGHHLQAQGRAPHPRQLPLRRRGHVQGDAGRPGRSSSHRAAALPRGRPGSRVHPHAHRGRQRRPHGALQCHPLRRAGHTPRGHPRRALRRSHPHAPRPAGRPNAKVRHASAPSPMRRT